MPTLINGETLHGTIIINKQNGYKVTLDVDKKYVPKDIELTMNVVSGSASTPATTIPVVPSLSINSSGLISSSVSDSESITPSVSAGYVSSGTSGTVTVSGNNTLQLPTQAAQTITPGTSNQTIASGKYLTGNQTIAGDVNLVGSNIASGKSIFGVSGSYTSDATATAADVMEGKTAYVNGQKVTGSLAIATLAEVRTYFGLS